MSIRVNLDEKLVNEAGSRSKAMNRSVAEQIEHWVRIGRVAEENPD